MKKESIVDDMEQYSLSGADILQSLHGKCNLIQYKNIDKYINLKELLGKDKKCVILYNTNENYGHWTCIYEYNDTIFFFDSYGIIPDDELKWRRYYGADISNYRYLTKLLYESMCPVEYNEYQLQQKKDGINTCGRWVINRLKYPQISVDDYYNIFKQSSRYIDNDKLICLLVPISKKYN